MIIKGLFELIYTLLGVVLTPFQIIPNMPTTVTQWLDTFKSFIMTPIEIFLYFNIPWVLRTTIPVFLVILNMSHIYDGIMWVLKKLPFVGIE